MEYWAKITHICSLTLFNLILFKTVTVKAQSHQWITSYSSCSKPCDGGIQTLIKECFTTGITPEPAFKQYCETVPVVDPLTTPCNTQPCTLCERTYDTVTGTITSPYYPEKFTLPTHCKLNIELPSDKRAIIAFKEFILEGLGISGLTEEDLCLCGTVCLIHDPNFEELRDELCGTKPPFVWVSQSNLVEVEFYTENHDIFNRFLANYTAINAPPACYQFIDTEVEGPTGFITSSGFPNFYPDNLDCEYVIQADPVHRIVLFVESFQLEPSPNVNCDNDYLKISDLYTWRNDVYCGTHHSFAWVSDSNAVWIVFHTNDAFVYGGFLIAYEVMDRDYYPLVYTTFPGEITSPGYPLTYPPFSKFEYLIHAKPTEVIIITFNEFHLEAPHFTEDDQIALCERLGFTDTNTRQTLEDCLDMIENTGDICGRICYVPCNEDTAQDFIEILDVYYNENVMYCGFLPTFSWISKGSEVLLRFYSDENEDYKGFTASYRTVERRPPNDWELVFRVAMGLETDGADKWLDDTKGYNEGLKQAQSTTIGSYRQTYKNRIVNDWQEIGIQKVKIELYTAGSVVTTFIFEGAESTDLTDWFTCENLIYSPYSNLEDCDGLVFQIDEQGFEIANVLGASPDDCTDDDGTLWLDFQDVPGSNPTCSYEDAASSNTRFFYSTLATGSPTSTGTGMQYADVFTIWIQRDCDQHLTISPSAPETVQSENYGISNYPHFEYCDIYVSTDPLEQVVFSIEDFIMQTDCELQKDYVVIEDVTSDYSEQFCGKQSDVEWTSVANAAILRFRTDGSINYAGFQAEVKTKHRNLEDCSSLIHSPFGNLTNLHYPLSPRDFRHQGCNTLIHAPPDDRVIFTFNEFVLETDIGPELVIIDSFGNEALIPLSGQLYPFSWTSASNELSLWYYPQPFKSYFVYSANHRRLEQPLPAGCLEFYDGEFSGIFDWPLLALPTGSQNCYTIIRTNPVLNRRVTLTFSNLVLQLTECDAYMQVLDSTTKRSDMYCTTSEVSFTWTSDANEVIVKFFHGPLPALHQFEAQYTSLQRVDPKWYQVKTEADGHFWSPNYPNLYPNDIPVAEYLLHANAHQLVIVVFTDFGLEGTDAKGTCHYDYVRLYDPLNKRIDRYCGEQPPFGWCSTGNEVLVSLIVDKTSQKRGFYANYAFLPRPEPAACGGLFLEENGQFSSPNYPRAYGDNKLCVYVIQVPPTKIIVIEFTQLVTEPDVKCQKDHLEVRDKISGKKDIYCGDVSVPFTWRSEGNVVLMTFFSDLANSQYSGFVGSFTTEDREDLITCLEEFQAESGTIKSPRFPNDYNNNALCRYEIEVDEGFAVELSFIEFTLEPANPATSECDFDHVEIFDGNGVSLGKVCGTKGPFERRVTTNKVTLKFSSDFISFYKGFVVNYQQVDLTTPPPSCDQKFAGTTGVFTSPNYPGNYPDNTECRFEIEVAESLRIKITFNDFSLEGYPDCPYDYVKVSDVVEGIEERYCGRSTGPIQWSSESNKVLIIFKTDDRTPSSGFLATYETEPIPEAPASLTGCEASVTTETEAESGQLTSPNYPRPYALNQDCRIRIILTPGKACSITFTEFNLEDHPNCAYDFVELSTYPNGPSERYCGQPNVPFTWQSSGHICEVHFQSDSFVAKPGYRGTYEAVDAPDTVIVSTTPTQAPAASECQQELGGSSGIFTTPNYPQEYPLNVVCHTRILVPVGFVIQVTFREFDVEDQAECAWDYVQIVDQGPNAVTSQRFCGNFKQSFTYTSESNEIIVNFSSDNWEARTGYYASYKALLSNSVV